MNSRRFDIRPIASRRLRAALLLVFVLGLVGLSQSRLNGVELAVALLALCVIFADGWRRTRMHACALLFDDRPLECRLIGSDGQEIALSCKRASVYPWLIVLHFEAAALGQAQWPIWLNRAVVLLPDSLADASQQDWRRLLIWARLNRRQLTSR